VTENDNLNEIQQLIIRIQSDRSMYPAKQKAIVCQLESAEEAISKSEEDYKKEERISGISSKLTIIFVPMFIIFLLIHSYGIPNYIPPLTDISFFISMASFVIAMANMAIAPKLYWILQKIFKSKSA